jgi:hypothetical protein
MVTSQRTVKPIQRRLSSFQNFQMKAAIQAQQYKGEKVACTTTMIISVVDMAST